MAKLLYQGHGSFRLESNIGTMFYIDPYAGAGYDLPADFILVTHEHGDHNHVELPAKKHDTRILRAEDFLKYGSYHSEMLKDAKVTAVPAYNRNHSSEKCVGFIVFIDGITLYFAGDTSKTDAMEGYVKDLKPDYAFLPTDGIYNMNAKEASLCADMIGAKHSVPVHTAPGKLFSQTVAGRFHTESRLIITPGEEIDL